MRADATALVMGKAEVPQDQTLEAVKAAEHLLGRNGSARLDLPPAEVLGTSTDDVLRELADCDDDALARLRAVGVIQ